MGDKVALWRSRTPPNRMRDAETRGLDIAEIEDGFIRSAGLGANCVPPLSMILDAGGIYFDPARPSDLEQILMDQDIGSALRDRAKALRRELVAKAISKYGVDAEPLPRPTTERQIILVVGQVEDDRAVQTGGLGLSNLDLLRRTRDMEPDAHIIYKPHPDVTAGHRKGHIPLAHALGFADEVQSAAPIHALLNMADRVHVITSQVGFEALLRGKAVVTHGIPFYAGWGLTQDLAPAPQRRGRRRTLDELVAAALLLYPRYLDPVSRLPCSAELLITRMAAGEAKVTSPLVPLRRLQGRARTFWRKMSGVLA